MAAALGACGTAHETTDADADSVVDVGPEDAADGPLEEPSPDGMTDGGDGDIEPRSGAPTLVNSEIELLTDLLFDLDGNGSLDNFLGGYGPFPSDDGGPEVFASLLTAAMQAGIDQGRSRSIVHFFEVEDREEPRDDDAPMVICEGVDFDDPPDPEDDFSGGESFYASASCADPCGEPLHVFGDSRIDGGLLTARADRAYLGVFPLGTAYAVQVTGEIAPAGASAELTLGSYVLAAELARQADSDSDYSMLEFFVGGGGLHEHVEHWGEGVFNPDIDVDGDGLERFVLDDEGRIDHCLDGDLSSIPGRECGQDERIADAFSFTMRLTFVSALFLGLEPGWEGLVEGECEDPPAESGWGAP